MNIMFSSILLNSYVNVIIYLFFFKIYPLLLNVMEYRRQYSYEFNVSYFL